MADPATAEVIVNFFKEKRDEAKQEQEKDKEIKMTSMHKSPTSLTQSSKMLKLVTNNIMHSQTQTVKFPTIANQTPNRSFLEGEAKRPTLLERMEMSRAARQQNVT